MAAHCDLLIVHCKDRHLNLNQMQMGHLILLITFSEIRTSLLKGTQRQPHWRRMSPTPPPNAGIIGIWRKNTQGKSQLILLPNRRNNAAFRARQAPAGDNVRAIRGAGWVTDRRAAVTVSTRKCIM